jgi:hypothetical protein
MFVRACCSHSVLGSQPCIKHCPSTAGKAGCWVWKRFFYCRGGRVYGLCLNSHPVVATR